MRQYTPFDMECWPELNRTVTDQEYEDACTLFRSLGLSGFFQQEQAVGESFIPAFDGSGLEEELSLIHIYPAPPALNAF